MKNKFLKNLCLVLFGFLLLLTFMSPVHAAETIKSNYYGYLSKSVVLEALSKHPEIPSKKKAALIDKLSIDGYFWLDTSRKKLNYIHKNLPNNQYLLIVANAENVHSWTVNDKNISETVYVDEVEIQQKMAEAAREGAEDWKIYATYAEQYLNIHPEFQECARFLNGGGISPILCKKLWSQGHLNALYDKYWPDKKQNRNKLEFDKDEKKKIERINVIMQQEAFSRDVVIACGITGESPWDDILLFVPIEKIFAWGGKLLLKGVTGVGSKVIENSTFKIAYRVVGDKFTAIGAARLMRKITPRILTLNNNVMGFLKVDFSKFFKYSTLTDEQMNLVVKKLATNLEELSKHSEYSKYVSVDQLRKIFESTSVIFPSKLDLFSLSRKYLKIEWWGQFNTTTKKILINEDVVVLGGESLTKQIYVHEVFHSMADSVRISERYLSKYSSKKYAYAQLDEGFTEFLTLDFMKSSSAQRLGIGYRHDVSVVGELYTNLLNRWHDPKLAMQAIREIYFKDGIKVGIDKYFGIGSHDKIYTLMNNGKFQEAEDLIEKIVF
jgi:hypothetical protein